MDIVQTVDDWYDGPREGAADFQGSPFWYRSIYLDSEIWNPDEDRFDLTPLTPEALGWAVESIAIFTRWDDARKSGRIIWDESDDESFGALPEERVRRRDVCAASDRYLTEHRAVLRVHGRFEPGCDRVTWRLLDP